MKEASFKTGGDARVGFLTYPTFRAVVAAAALIGACILWISTRWGIGLYTDSIVYIGAARSILEGDGLSFFTDVGEFAPVTQYPPLYSYLVAAFAMLGFDPLEGARWISVLFFAGNAILVTCIVYRSTSSYIASLIATFFALSSFPMIYIHSQALTEPMFIFLVLLGFAFLALYLQHSRLWMIYAASLIIGLSCIARYVGVAFVLTGTMVVLCLGETTWKQKFAHAILFGALASSLFIAWVCRNLLLVGNAWNRTFGVHPPALKDLLPATDTIGYWLIPSEIVDAAPGLTRWVLGIVFLFLCWLGGRVGLPRSRYIQMVGLCPVGYFIFLLISWSFNDQPLYLDTRTMALPYVAIMILTVSMITDWFRAARPRAKSWRWFTFDCLLIVIALTQLINGVVWLRYSYFNGIGFSIERWRNSEILNFVKDGQVPKLIFSNAPDFIYTFTGKRASLIPRKVNANTMLPNQHYSAEIAGMQEELRKNQGIVIYFDADARLWYLPSKEELQTKVSLRVLKTASDGTVYGIDGVAKVSNR
jgi:4-amino-4-deoxy-L-arabinose transferase-like glycosyltransferase